MERETRSSKNVFIPAQQILPWLSQNEGPADWENLYTLPALRVSELPPMRRDQLIGDLWKLACCYLRDLETSVSIQQRILAKQPPKLDGMEMAWHYLPAMGVSGDYYDLLPLREGQYSVAIGDACGKGMGAALLATSVCATLRAQAQSRLKSVGELLSYLNQIVYHDTPTHQFMTLLYGVCDVNNHTFTYSSAGHPPVLHYQAATKQVYRLNVGGVVLGAFGDGTEYPTETISLGMGDALVMYTDGIIEARNGSDEEFGIDRLSDVVMAYGDRSSEELLKSILNAVSQFAEHGCDDDITLMVVKAAPMLGS